MPTNPPSNPSSQRPPNQIIQRTSVEFSGPLPPPEVLEKFDRIVPGAAERIIRMAEQQSEHRHRLESKVIGANTRDSLLGLIFGFLVSMGFLSAACLAFYTGYAWQATVLAAIDLVGLASAFIYGTHSRRHERLAKHQPTQHQTE